ncbi:MAG: hypothetical protein ACXWDO_06685 [Bacteroidia bacterium]
MENKNTQTYLVKYCPTVTVEKIFIQADSAENAKAKFKEKHPTWLVVSVEIAEQETICEYAMDIRPWCVLHVCVCANTAVHVCTYGIKCN